MAEPRTLSVAWLPKGVLKSVPDKVNLEEDELLEIKEKLGNVKEDESEEELESEDEEMEQNRISDEKKALRPELEKVLWERKNVKNAFLSQKSF
jgi:hypothetical protein